MKHIYKGLGWPFASTVAYKAWCSISQQDAEGQNNALPSKESEKTIYSSVQLGRYSMSLGLSATS